MLPWRKSRCEHSVPPVAGFVVANSLTNRIPIHTIPSTVVTKNPMETDSTSTDVALCYPESQLPRPNSADVSSLASASGTTTASWELMGLAAPTTGSSFEHLSTLQTPSRGVGSHSSCGTEDGAPPPNVPATRLLRAVSPSEDGCAQATPMTLPQATKARARAATPLPVCASSLASIYVCASEGATPRPVPHCRSEPQLPAVYSAIGQDWSLITTPESMSPPPSAFPSFPPTAQGTQRFHAQVARGHATSGELRPHNSVRRLVNTSARPNTFRSHRHPPSFTHVPSASSLGSFEEIRMEDVVSPRHPTTPPVAAQPPSPHASSAVSVDAAALVSSCPLTDDEREGSVRVNGGLCETGEETTLGGSSTDDVSEEGSVSPATLMLTPRSIVHFALGVVCKDLARHWYAQLRIVLGRPPTSGATGRGNTTGGHRRRRRRDKDRQARREQWVSPLAQSLRHLAARPKHISGDTDSRESGEADAPRPTTAWLSRLDLTADVLTCALHSVLILLI